MIGRKANRHKIYKNKTWSLKVKPSILVEVLVLVLVVFVVVVVFVKRVKQSKLLVSSLEFGLEFDNINSS